MALFSVFQVFIRVVPLDYSYCANYSILLQQISRRSSAYRVRFPLIMALKADFAMPAFPAISASFIPPFLLILPHSLIYLHFHITDFQIFCIFDF